MAHETPKQIELRLFHTLKRHGCEHVHVIHRTDPLSGEVTIQLRDRMTTRMTELTSAAADELVNGLAHRETREPLSMDKFLDLVDAHPDARKLALHPHHARRAQKEKP